MSAIKIGASGRSAVRLDVLKLIDTRLLVQASSGGGKSWLLRKIAEEAAKHLQIIIFDPEGEFGTLREKHDFLLVGEEGELKPEVRSAALLARRLAELKVSAVLDLYELKLAQRREFVSGFLNALMNVPKKLWHDVLVIIDEAHVFAPEKGNVAAQSLDAVITLMTQGRKRGFCGLLATQRLSALSKDAAAQAKNVLIGSTTLDVDLQRAGMVLGMGSRERTKLMHLSPGEFWGFGPALSFLGVGDFKVGDVQTTHPRPGKRRQLVMPAPSKAIKGMLDEFEDLPEQAEQEIKDMEQAKAKIAELRREVQNLEQRAANGQQPGAEELAQLQRDADDTQQQLALYKQQADKTVSRMCDYIKDIVLRVGTAIDMLQLPPVPDVSLPAAPNSASSSRKKRSPPDAASSAAVPIISVHERTYACRAVHPTQDVPRGSLKSRILDAVAWWNSAGVEHPTRRQVTFAACAKPKSSHSDNTISALRTQDLLSYPAGGRIALTAAGRRVANAPDKPATLTELHDRVRLVLKGGLPLRIFDALVRHGELSREGLAGAIEQSRTSSHFDNTISSLRTSGIVAYPSKGHVALSVAFKDLT
jgi:cell fate (sporulation/competence/biofilm development) regulator YlbF (YheA/YmcA/DUF963 family)